jgi:hypothetical protein
MTMKYEALRSSTPPLVKLCGVVMVRIRDADLTPINDISGRRSGSKDRTIEVARRWMPVPPAVKAVGRLRLPPGDVA